MAPLSSPILVSTKAQTTEFRRIAELFRPYMGQWIAGLFCMIVSSIIGIAPPLIAADIIDSAIPQSNAKLLVRDVSLILFLAIAIGLLGVLQGYLNAIVGNSVMRDLRTKIASHLHRMPLSFFIESKTGEIMNRVSGDVDAVGSIVSGSASAVITNVLLVVTTVPVLFVMNWKIALTAICVVPLLLIPIGPVGRKLYAIHKAARESRDQIESLTQETLSSSGIELIKMHGREDYEKQRFYGASTNLLKLDLALVMISRWFNLSMGALVLFGPATIWLVGGWLAIQHAADVGAIVAFIALAQGRLYGPVASITGIQTQYVTALAVFRRIFEYLDLEPEALDAKAALNGAESGATICFRSVDFSYVAERPALRNVSFTVNSGEVVAIVGVSGSGKSTIAKLLPRLYTPSSGEILIDGTSVLDTPRERLRRDIGIVSSDTYLFNDTIANNLRYARLDATDTDLHDAARAANILGHILSLPSGFDTVVGDRGYKFSAGERQRLAIARVILKDPRILILDEATSHLDAQNEDAIFEALSKVTEGRTCLVISHRLSTLQKVGIILVMDNGTIVARGTHADLLSESSIYARLYAEQATAQR